VDNQKEMKTGNLLLSHFFSGAGKTRKNGDTPYISTLSWKWS